jgi:hypothetical protein
MTVGTWAIMRFIVIALVTTILDVRGVSGLEIDRNFQNNIGVTVSAYTRILFSFSRDTCLELPLSAMVILLFFRSTHRACLCVIAYDTRDILVHTKDLWGV